MQQRPTGITILALVYILLASLSLLWSLFVFGLAAWPPPLARCLALRV
jgi:hypothetical protein